MYNKNINKNTKTLITLFIALNIIAVVIFVYMFIQINKSTSDIAKIDGDIRNFEDKSKEINSIKHILFDTKKDTNKLDSYFVNSDNVVVFIKNIESLGKTAGVSLELNSVDISNLNDASLFLTFTTKGEWSGSIYLLALLESMPVKMNIKKVNLVKRKDMEDKNFYWEGEFNIELLSFIKSN